MNKFKWKFTYPNNASNWSEESFPSKIEAFVNAVNFIQQYEQNPRLDVISIVVRDTENIDF